MLGYAVEATSHSLSSLVGRLFFFASDHDVLKQVVTHRENSDTWKTLLTDHSKKK